MKIDIVVENVKCEGCAAIIQKELKTLDGIDAVEVNVSERKVTLQYVDESAAGNAKKKLASLGYPERGPQ